MRRAAAVAGQLAGTEEAAAAGALAGWAVQVAEVAAARQQRPGEELAAARWLVAQGCTDAQIAAKLYISIRTVRSHLDRIRDKTGCRRRADLTRLALSTELL